MDLRLSAVFALICTCAAAQLVRALRPVRWWTRLLAVTAPVVVASATVVFFQDHKGLILGLNVLAILLLIGAGYVPELRRDHGSADGAPARGLGFIGWAALPLSLGLSTLAISSDWSAVGLATGAVAVAVVLHLLATRWLNSTTSVAQAISDRDATIRSLTDSQHGSGRVIEQLQLSLRTASEDLDAARERNKQVIDASDRRMQNLRDEYENARLKRDDVTNRERLTLIQEHRSTGAKMQDEVTAALERAGRAESKLYPTVAEKCRNSIIDLLNHRRQTTGTSRIDFTTLRARLHDTDLGMLLAVLRSLEEAHVVIRDHESSSIGGPVSDYIDLAVNSVPHPEGAGGEGAGTAKSRREEEVATALSRVERLQGAETWNHLAPIMGSLLTNVDALIDELPTTESGALVQARRRFHASNFDDEQVLRERLDELEDAAAKLGDAAEPLRRLSRMAIGDPLGEPTTQNYRAWRRMS